MVTISSSVVKRDSRGAQDVISELRNSGWNRTGSAVNGRVVYMENSGFSLTVVEGPMGTVVLPSGPVRGRLFGNSGLNLGIMDGGLTGFSMPGPIQLFSQNNTTTSREGSRQRDAGVAAENPEQPARKQFGESDFV